MEHTPEPWGASRVNGTSPTFSITGAGGALLADVYHEKNVPVIREAPKLLAALQALRAVLHPGALGLIYSQHGEERGAKALEAVNLADDALANATGVDRFGRMVSGV